MVSFQCHACGDIVKKPKLDQHHSRCHGGFDCIDCSKTFNSPAEFKTHTSCISEAEKYQKSLYKGPTRDQRNGRANVNQNGVRGQNYHQNINGRGGYRGRAGAGAGGGRLWNQPLSPATGANDTPLGTPTRMSPVTNVEGTVEDQNKKRKAEDEAKDQSKKKAKTDTETIETPSITVSPAEQRGVQEGKKAKDEKKEKKKKERAGEKDSSTTPSHTNGAVETTIVKDKIGGKTEKKDKKKAKKDKQKVRDVAEVKDGQMEGIEMKDGSIEEERGKVKKAKKEKKEDRKDKDGGQSEITEKKSEKDEVKISEKTDKDVSTESQQETKKKKKRKEPEGSGQYMDRERDMPQEVLSAPSEKKKEKKRKREKEGNVDSS